MYGSPVLPCYLIWLVVCSWVGSRLQDDFQHVTNQAIVPWWQLPSSDIITTVKTCRMQESNQTESADYMRKETFSLLYTVSTDTSRSGKLLYYGLFVLFFFTKNAALIDSGALIKNYYCILSLKFTASRNISVYVRRLMTIRFNTVPCTENRFWKSDKTSVLQNVETTRKDLKIRYLQYNRWYLQWCKRIIIQLNSVSFPFFMDTLMCFRLDFSFKMFPWEWLEYKKVKSFTG